MKTSGGGGGKLFKLFFLLLLAVLLVGGAVGGYLYYRASASRPQVDGLARLQGLSASAEVLRDSYGVPHIYGASIADLARATGYVHAQDRYFQMELSRRMSKGRLAELLGPAALANDRDVIRLGLEGAALAELERMAPEAREALEAYVAGVNAYREASLEHLPPEFQLLDLVPTPWEASDSLAISKLLAYRLSENGSVELLRADLARKLGLSAAYLLTGLVPPDDGSEIFLPERSSSWIAGEFRPQFSPGASNAWVVSGARSGSGRPLLASDPHLPLTMPSVWYELHLSGGGLDVAGASLPGLPFVLIGHNRRIAWGMTALYADVQDHYVETLSPENPSYYAAGEEWRELETITHSIPVAGQSPSTLEVKQSRHGVILTEAPAEGQALALRWDAAWSGDHVLAAIRLNGAGSWQEFTEALRSWSSPALAFVYADVEGNIGFFPGGEIPVRVGFDGTLPLDGASGAQEWEGTVPHELKPMIFNPETGLIVSANHQLLPAETPYPLGRDTLAPFRAQRIDDMLQANSSLGIDDLARMQDDRYDHSVDSILRQLVGLRAGDNERQAQALAILRKWDGQMSNGPAPAIYHAFHQELLAATFRDDLGDDLFEAFLAFLEIGHGGGIQAIIEDPQSSFWDDAATAEREGRTQIFFLSFEAALDRLTRESGGDMESWDWGKLHGVTFRHPLGKDPPVSWVLNRGPVPFGGSTHSVANSVVSLREPFDSVVGSSFRLIVDLAAVEAARSIVPTGASGHLLSPHYFDLNQGWLQGISHPLLFDRSAIEADLTGKLVLQP